jgi:hypothetical protein
MLLGSKICRSYTVDESRVIFWFVYTSNYLHGCIWHGCIHAPKVTVAGKYSFSAMPFTRKPHYLFSDL